MSEQKSLFDRLVFCMNGSVYESRNAMVRYRVNTDCHCIFLALRSLAANFLFLCAISGLHCL